MIIYVNRRDELYLARKETKEKYRVMINDLGGIDLLKC